MKLQSQLIEWDEGIELAAYNAFVTLGLPDELENQVSDVVSLDWPPLICQTLEVLQREKLK